MCRILSSFEGYDSYKVRPGREDMVVLEMRFLPLNPQTDRMRIGPLCVNQTYS